VNAGSLLTKLNEMKILVLNCGSSSIKYQLLDMTDERVLASGGIDRIGLDESEFKHCTCVTEKITEQLHVKDHEQGVELILNKLIDPVSGIIKDKKEIVAVGHRVVHGGEDFSDSVILDQKVLDKVEECSEIAPLHNPANLRGIYAAKKCLPGAIQCGTFDTAFHQTMPPSSYLYPIPYECYEKYRVRKYGFHGSSHKFISSVAAGTLGLDYQKSKIITCHLGNGASVAAILNGKSIDTSMGFTPLEGLMMGTRSGNLDIGALLFLMKKETNPNDTVAQLLKRSDDLLNKKSGMVGISGFSDMRDAQKGADEGNERCILALDMYAYRVKKYIGSYAAAMGGVDAVVFSGGIGENSVKVREAICSGLEFLGISFDKVANANSRGELKVISTATSRVKVIVVPTNEELVIARDAKDLVLNHKPAR